MRVRPVVTSPLRLQPVQSSRTHPRCRGEGGRNPIDRKDEHKNGEQLAMHYIKHHIESNESKVSIKNSKFTLGRVNSRMILTTTPVTVDAKAAAGRGTLV